MKKIAIIFLLAIAMTLGWSGTAITSINAATVAPTQQTRIEEEQKITVEKLVVQREHDIFSFTKPSESMGIVVSAKDLYTLAYRKSGEDVGVKKQSELTFLQAGLEEGTSEKAFTYIRLVQTPFIPDEGVNEFPRKDIVIYVDPKYPNDAFVGVQNPNKLEEWQIYKVNDYGNWLRKEIALYISLYTGL